MSTTIRITAVQPAFVATSVEDNLVRVERLVRAAVAEQQPHLVTLPSAIGGITGPQGVRPVDGAPLTLLRILARDLGVVVTGGFLAQRGAHAYSTWALVEPDGSTLLSNRRLPGAAATLRTGSGPATTRVHALDNASVGLIGSSDWSVHATVRRLHGNVQLVVGAAPSTAGLLIGSAAYIREVPRQLARLLAVPVVVSAPVGHGGATRIIDASGRVAAELGSRREGWISAEVCLDDDMGHPAVDPALAAHWLRPEHSIARRALSAATTAGSSAAYSVRRLLGRHDWQRWPGADLPDVLGADEATRQAATSSPASLLL